MLSKTKAFVRPSRMPGSKKQALCSAYSAVGLDTNARKNRSGDITELLLHRILTANGILLGRRFLGIEKEEDYAKISKARREEIEDIKTFETYKRKIPDIVKAECTQKNLFSCNESIIERLQFL